MLPGNHAEPLRNASSPRGSGDLTRQPGAGEALLSGTQARPRARARADAAAAWLARGLPQVSRVTGSPPRLPVSPIPPGHAQRRKAEPGEPPSRGLWTTRGGLRRGGLRRGCPRLAGPWRPQLQWKIFRRPTEAARRAPRPFPPGASARVPLVPGERPRPRPALLRKPRPPRGNRGVPLGLDFRNCERWPPRLRGDLPCGRLAS